MAAPSSGGTFLRKYLNKITCTSENITKQLSRLVPPPNLKESIVEMIPHHVNVYSLSYKEQYPDYKIIHLIRDGKDSVNGRIEAKHKTDSIEYVKRGFIGINEETFISLEKHQQFAYFWKMYVENGIKLRGYKNYLEIKYESLVFKPERTYKQIIKFLELPFNKDHLNDLKELVYTDRVGLYKKMNKRERLEIMNIIRPIMIKLGYVQ